MSSPFSVFALLLVVIAVTLTGAALLHKEMLATEKKVLVYKLYVDCTQEHNKDQCSYLLKSM